MDIYGNEVYNIRQVLKEMVNLLHEIVAVLRKPENKFKRLLEYFVLFVGAMGFISVVERIISLVRGGL